MINMSDISGIFSNMGDISVQCLFLVGCYSGSLP